MSLKAKFIKNSKIKETETLINSKLWSPKDYITTRIPALNLALSGDLYGGMGPGLLQIAGKSRRFKSKFALEIAEAFLKKFSDGIVLFYDSEFGTPQSYWNGITLDNVIHSPISTVEQLKQDMASQLKIISVDDNEKVLIVIDSIGNLASSKELLDAEEGNEITDMTRAKALKSLFRVTAPGINQKGVYVIAINHTYDPIGGTAKAEIVGGGTGSIYNANAIWVITAEKETDAKDKKETTGFTFNIKIEKSRFVRQNSRIPVTVMFETGIERWSGLFDLAIESGHIIRPNQSRYALASNPEEIFFRKEMENSDPFMEALIKTDFADWCRANFQYKE